MQAQKAFMKSGGKCTPEQEIDQIPIYLIGSIILALIVGFGATWIARIAAIKELQYWGMYFAVIGPSFVGIYELWLHSLRYTSRH